MYTCATVEQALEDQGMRDVHLERWSLAGFTLVHPCNKLWETEWHLFKPLSILVCHRSLFWTSPYTLISTMTTLNIFYIYMPKMTALNIFTCTCFNKVSQYEHFYVLLFQRWYTLNIAAGIWRYDTTSFPQRRNSVGGSNETEQKIKHPVY